MISYDLTGKTALVTGGASGIGFATARMLAKFGATVAINFLADDPRGPEAVNKLLDEGGRAQVELAVPLARLLAPDLIVSSPLPRAVQSAEIISRGAGGIEIVTDDRLEEVRYGDWEGKEWGTLSTLRPMLTIRTLPFTPFPIRHFRTTVTSPHHKSLPRHPPNRHKIMYHPQRNNPLLSPSLRSNYPLPHRHFRPIPRNRQSPLLCQSSTNTMGHPPRLGRRGNLASNLLRRRNVETRTREMV